MSSAKTMSDHALKMIAERFKVLSEPTRLKLIMALRNAERNVTSLVEVAGSTQANVSRHLQQLTEAGILSRRKEGLNVYYKIADPGIFQLCELVCGSLEDHLRSQMEAFATPQKQASP